MTTYALPRVKFCTCFETLSKKLKNGLINLCLQAWNNDVFNQDFTAESLVEELHIEGKQYLYLALDENNDVAGYLIEVPFEEEIREEKYGMVAMPLPEGTKYSDVAYLESIAVFANQQGKGYGQALCERFFQDCKARNFKKVVLFTLSNNTESIKFFERVGFRMFNKITRNVEGEEKEFIYFYHNL